jgi:group I intron endonuclease
MWKALDGSNLYFHNAIKKYGPDAFEKEIIHICESKEEMDFVETFYISLFNTKFPNGYNMTDGGDGFLGYVPSEEVRRKTSERMKGKKLSEEHKLKISKALKGKPTWSKGKQLSEETKKKMSLVRKGHIVSEETRNKLSIANKGQISWRKGLKFKTKNRKENTNE